MYHRFSPVLFPSHLAGFQFLEHIYIQAEWKAVWILISWLLKPADLDLHCFQILKYPSSAYFNELFWHCPLFNGEIVVFKIGKLFLKIDFSGSNYSHDNKILCTM